MPKNKTISYDEWLYENLKDPLEAGAYLQAALDDPDPRVFTMALTDIIKSRLING